MKTYLAAAVAVVLAQGAQAVPVDVELQLLVDVSGSVSGSEFVLQRDGYVGAFRDPDIISAIQGGDEGSIAAQLIYWSGSSQQIVAADWTFINDAASANAFADEIAAFARPFSGGTSIGPALDFGRPLFVDNGFEGETLVQDVSGDGTSSTGATEAARDASAAAGIVINGLPIGGSASLQAFYLNSVVTADGFSLPAASFDEFADAVTQKIGQEITDGQIPLPAPILLLGTAILGLGVVSRARKA